MSSQATNFLEKSVKKKCIAVHTAIVWQSVQCSVKKVKSKIFTSSIITQGRKTAVSTTRVCSLYKLCWPIKKMVRVLIKQTPYPSVLNF